VNDDVRALVEYRFSQAQDTLEAGRDLRAAGHLRDAVNRAYYAMFYASLALLASRMLGASKHTGVLGLFSKEFVLTGQISAEAGRHLREAFDLRQRCDYREFVDVTDEQAEEILAHAGAFVEEACRLWERLKRSGGAA